MPISDPKCAALASAKASSGKSDAVILQEVGIPQTQLDKIFRGEVTPTTDEFNRIARVLGVTGSAPHDKAHTTRT